MAGDAVLGSTTCNIRVVFSIDTSTDDSIYKFVHENDTARSVSYTHLVRFCIFIVP